VMKRIEDEDHSLDILLEDRVERCEGKTAEVRIRLPSFKIYM